MGRGRAHPYPIGLRSIRSDRRRKPSPRWIATRHPLFRLGDLPLVAPAET